LKLVPDRQKIAENQQSGQTLGRGMDFALVVLVFLGIGYGLDRWLDTRPAFMIGLVVFSVVGQFLKMYFEYSATMKLHEAERVASIQRQPRHIVGAPDDAEAPLEIPSESRTVPSNDAEAQS
jgi:F0F1-type ATP synthase assembly protein I